jgi:hypothetical protein
MRTARSNYTQTTKQSVNWPTLRRLAQMCACTHTRTHTRARARTHKWCLLHAWSDWVLDTPTLWSWLAHECTRQYMRCSVKRSTVVVHVSHFRKLKKSVFVRMIQQVISQPNLDANSIRLPCYLSGGYRTGLVLQSSSVSICQHEDNLKAGVGQFPKRRAYKLCLRQWTMSNTLYV